MKEKDFDYIIEFENESSVLDFKATQYRKEKHVDLIKDIIAMANVNNKEDKFIIVGVNLKSNGERDILGISDEFVDDAIYQQLVNKNVEPEINFSYCPYKYQSVMVGIFHIHNNINPPYMLKKDYKTLNEGDSFIRKGSSQERITRKDIDLFYSQKFAQKDFSKNVNLVFKDSEDKKIFIPVLSDLEYPSDNARNQILKIIKEKEEVLKKTKDENFPSLAFLYSNSYKPILGLDSYKNRSISTLNENLLNLKKDYKNSDLYYQFETKANQINLTIINSSNEYIEDASIEICIKKSDGLIVANTIYSAPSASSRWRFYDMDESSWDKLNYPSVKETNENYTIVEDLDVIKHHVPKDAFKVPIRLFVSDEYTNDKITLKAKIFGKNLFQPLEYELDIIISK